MLPGDGEAVNLPATNPDTVRSPGEARAKADDSTGRRRIPRRPAPLAPLVERPVRVARGATSTVYRGTHRTLGIPVALKVLDERHADDHRMRERFAREARALSSIRCEGVVRILDLGESEDGRPAIVMEWLDGTDLERRIRTRGPLPVNEAMSVLDDVTTALEAAHRAGIVHRDVKPSNIVLVGSPGASRAVLLDFGVARLADDAIDTASGSILGTPAYMAPEQARDAASADARADIYALAAVFYAMVVGEPPHGPGDALTQLHRIATGYRASIVDAAPFVPRNVAALLDRCLSPDPADRPRSASEFREALLDATTTNPDAIASPSSNGSRALAASASAVFAAGAFAARLATSAEAASLLAFAGVSMAILALAALALRERSRFAPVVGRTRIERLLAESAPEATLAAMLALVLSSWADARAWFPVDPARAALGAGLLAFALAIRARRDPVQGSASGGIPTSRSLESSSSRRSSGGRSTSSPSRPRGTTGSSSPS